MRRDDSVFRLLVDRTLTALYASDDFPKLLKTYFGLRREILCSRFSNEPCSNPFERHRDALADADAHGRE